jgi:triphosphoribosyl-dephospho-CoA synthase
MVAMREAADRDMIARQYVTDFADVFETGFAALHDWRACGIGHAVALGVYLAFLSRFPDTHIARKQGLATANAVMLEAQDFAARMRGQAREPAFLSDLLAFDARLKGERINPGTSADLTVATLFAARLSGVLPISSGGG